MNIDSKYHVMLDLFRSGSLAEPVIMKDGGLFAKVVRDPSQIATASLFFEQVSRHPRFVFDADLVRMSMTDEVAQSALDMVEAGVFRLPFPEISVEIVNPDQNVRDFYIVTLEQPAYSTRITSTIACMTERSNPPFVMVLELLFETSFEKGPDGKLMFDTRVRGDEHLINNDDAMAPYLKAKNVAIVCATVVLQTLGLRRVTVDAPKLSRARVARGRAPIVPYTRITIGKVYRGADHDESDEYVPGKSPRPHWRRGHTRRYHYGAGRAETRVRWIPARMVAMAAVPEYRVSK